MTSIYGEKTKAKDGIEYSSKFEASVADYLLNNKVKYESQKYYGTETKHKCDFYLIDYDVWVECVYNKVQKQPAYTQHNNSVYLNIPYNDKEGRELAKRFRCVWIATKKLWLLERNGSHNRFIPLEKYMSKEDRALVYDANILQITDDYLNNLKRKIRTYEKTHNIITIDSGTFNRNSKTHVTNFIRLANPKLFQTLRASKPDLFPDIQEPKQIKVDSEYKKKSKALSKREKKIDTFKKQVNNLSMDMLVEFSKIIDQAILKKKKVA